MAKCLPCLMFQLDVSSTPRCCTRRFSFGDGIAVLFGDRSAGREFPLIHPIMQFLFACREEEIGMGERAPERDEVGDPPGLLPRERVVEPGLGLLVVRRSAGGKALEGG